MAYELSPYALLMGTISILALFLLFYPLYYRQKSRVAIYFLAMVASTVLWCIGYFLELAATDEATMMFWNFIQYLGILTLPPFFLLFILAFTHRHEIISKPILAFLFFPSLVHYFFLLTNESHSLFYVSVGVQSSSFGSSLDLTYGLLFYTNVVYSYLLLAFGYYLLVQTYIKSSESNPLYQKQLLVLIIGSTAPIIGNIIRIFYLIPTIDIDLTPISFVIAYIVFTYAIFEISFLDIVPFAHQFIITNLAEIGIITTTKDNRIIEINQPACQYIFERECPNIIGSDLFSILYSEKRLEPYHDGIRHIEHSLTEILEEPIQFEMEFELPRPRNQFFRITLQALRDKGETIGFIYIVQNISLEKEIETLLRKSIEFKNSLLTVISHDMKNQLMVIQGFTDVLRKELTLVQKYDELKEFLDGIDAKANQMQEIITDVRSYLKTMGTFGEPKDLSLINLKETISEVISSFKSAIKAKNLNLNVNWPSDPEIYTLADLRLRSVFNNLLDNALKWSPPDDAIEISVNKEDHFWVCSISDHGPGVPEEIKDEIFKPFVSIGSEDKVGSGLGLSISLEILQSYKSKIWIEDIKPHGAKFVFKLPITEKNKKSDV
ncbi:MAG: histidine kinase N-terminal 7TM domain-containing protein [Promethearchaeota archaeon]